MSRLMQFVEGIEARLRELRGAPYPLSEQLVARFDARAPGDLAACARLLRIVAEAGYCADCGRPETWPHDSWACVGCQLILRVRHAAEEMP